MTELIIPVEFFVTTEHDEEWAKMRLADLLADRDFNQADVSGWDFGATEVVSDA